MRMRSEETQYSSQKNRKQYTCCGHAVPGHTQTPSRLLALGVTQHTPKGLPPRVGTRPPLRAVLGSSAKQDIQMFIKKSHGS